MVRKKCIDNNTKTLNSVVFSPDGEKILTVVGEATARLFDFEGNLLAEIGKVY